MANEKDFSPIRSKDNLRGESVDTDLARRQLANVDALGAAAGHQIAEQLGAAICQQAVEAATNTSDAFGNAVEALLDCFEHTEGDPEAVDMINGFIIERHGPGPQDVTVTIPGVGHIPGATAIENDQELHDKFTDSLFAAMVSTLKPACAAAWKAKSQRPANVVPLFRKK
jgi:hypothetical protein